MLTNTCSANMSTLRCVIRLPWVNLILAICDMQCKVQEKQTIGYNVGTKALCGHSS